MKKALLFLTLAVGLFSCSTKSTEKQTATNTTTGEVKDHVELVYFHGKQRCITCRAIEKYSKEVVDSLNATGIPVEELTFRVVDINENESLADSYEVTGSSLFLVKYANGTESRDNLTAISPCPLATNIAAIGFISQNIENRKAIFMRGIYYTVGRVLAYTVLGIILISILKEGASMFGIQKAISKWGELLIGPVLLVIGLFMLFGHKLNLPKFGFDGSNSEKLAGKGSWGALLLGVLFAMAFCPSSGMFYFGMLIPMSVTATVGWFLPVLFAVATALPVLVVAWILAFSVEKVGEVYGKIQTIQKWLNIVVGTLFVIVGIYYCYTMYF